MPRSAAGLSVTEWSGLKFAIGSWRRGWRWRRGCPTETPSPAFSSTWMIQQLMIQVFRILIQSLQALNCSTLKYCFAKFFTITSIPRFIFTLDASKKSWLFLSWRWEGNALLWAARWNYKSPWQPCNRWIINVIQLLYIWNKQSIADVTEWTFQRTRLKKCLKSNSSLIMFWSSSCIDHM